MAVETVASTARREVAADTNGAAQTFPLNNARRWILLVLAAQSNLGTIDAIRYRRIPLRGGDPTGWTAGSGLPLAAGATWSVENGAADDCCDELEVEFTSSIDAQGVFVTVKGTG